MFLAHVYLLLLYWMNFRLLIKIVNNGKNQTIRAVHVLFLLPSRELREKRFPGTDVRPMREGWCQTTAMRERERTK